MFPFNVAAFGADAERGRNGEIRQRVFFAHRFDEFLHRFQIFDALSRKNMLHGSAGVFGLDIALQVQHFKHVVCIVDGQLRRVGVKRLVALFVQFFIGADDFGVSSGGNIDLDINLVGQGATVRQLVNDLSGQVIAILNKSVIQTGKLKFLTSNFINQLLDVLQVRRTSSKQIDVSCAVVRSDIKDGKAVFPKGIALNAEQMTVVSDGNINLLNDKIDFSIKPNITDVSVIQAIASFIKVQGTLQNPKIVLDDMTAARTVIGVAATGGTFYLGSQLLQADSSPCYTALKGTSYQNRFPAPSGVVADTQDVYQDTERQINETIVDVKKAAKDFLNMLKN